MITEEEIVQDLKGYHEKINSFRGNHKKQEQIHDERNQFLHKAFQQNSQLILKLFWKFYKEWIQLSEQERNKEPRYSDELFWSIIDSSTSEAIELARQIMVETEDLYKEEAARYLGEAKDPTTVPYLIEGLKSLDYNVVSKSALALGNIGDPRAESYLLEIVDRYNTDEVYGDDRIDDAYPIIRYNTFIALCLLNTPGARQKIIQSLFHDRDIGIQERAIRYLVAEMPMEAIPYLEELCKHSNEEIATLAKGYLAELNRKH